MSDPASSDAARPDATSVPQRVVMPWQEQPDPFRRADPPVQSSPCHAIQAKPLPAGALPCAKPGVADPTSLAPIALTIAAGLCLGSGAIILRSKGRAPAGKPRSRTAQRKARRWQIAAWLLVVAGLGCLVMIATLDLPFA